MLVAIGLSVVLVAGLWFLTDRTIRSTLDDAARDAVDVDLAGLVDIYASGGQRELEQRLADRLAITPSDGSIPHYLLADGAGKRFAGDIAAWPQLDASVSESGTIRIGEATHAFARATQLGPDLKLVVSHEASDGRPLLTRVALVFLLGGGLLIVCVGLFGKMAGGNLQRRIEHINQAFRDPEPGDLRILAESERKDEIDELAGHSAAALQRVRDLMQAYRDTSDQVAHEIRTPLMHLDRKLVKALETKPEVTVAEGLVAARSDIRRLVSTLESLLDITASNARRGDRSGLKPVNLSELATRICELYASSTEESGHNFAWSIEPDVGLDGEEAQLSRLVTNLLDNALKYVPSGGSVSLGLAAGPVLIIADDGPGIPKSDRELVFDRFYRSDNVTQHQPGSGLGLALARAIAERHGLVLDLLDSEKGASFRIWKGA
ncbi:MAG: HAMP domain-containing sensor histidine kinase [Pontixanthobacter sp.]